MKDSGHYNVHFVSVTKHSRRGALEKPTVSPKVLNLSSGFFIRNRALGRGNQRHSQFRLDRHDPMN